MVQEGLVRLQDAGGLPVKGSGVAADWTVHLSGRTYTFYLKPVACWSDGKPVTAHDFVYAWARGRQFDYAYQLEYVEEVKAADEHTLAVTLVRPTPYFLSLTAFPTYFPLRQDVVARLGDAYATAPDRMVYNGLFAIMSWRHEDSLTVAKNPAYWDAGAVMLQEVQWKMVKDANTAINMFERGELDAT